jgi:hypothetical protein
LGLIYNVFYTAETPARAPRLTTPPRPPRNPQISAITPFQIVVACVFGFIVYGMAGLRPGYEAILKSGLISTLMYLIASQARGTARSALQRPCLAGPGPVRLAVLGLSLGTEKRRAKSGPRLLAQTLPAALAAAGLAKHAS